MLTRAIKKTSNLNRDSLLVILSTPYSVEFKDIKRILQTYILILHNDPQYLEVLKQGYKCVAKKAPTLGTMLPPSVIQSKMSQEPPTSVLVADAFVAVICMYHSLAL